LTITDLSPATPVLIVASALVGLFALVYDMLRSWRTVAAWAICAAVVLVGGTQDGFVVVQGAAVLVFVVLVLIRNEFLWSMRADDWRFVEAYRRVRERIHDLPPAREIGAENFARQWEAITAEFEHTHAPDTEWLKLKDATIAELRARKAVIEDPIAFTPEWLEGSRVRWAALQNTFDRLIKEHMGFWLISPWSGRPR
jgi:hypothetical protein